MRGLDLSYIPCELRQAGQGGQHISHRCPYRKAAAHAKGLDTPTPPKDRPAMNGVIGRVAMVAIKKGYLLVCLH